MTAESANLTLAVCGFFVLWTAQCVIAITWLHKSLNSMKREIIMDFDQKHEANRIRYDALFERVIRHDVMLKASK